MDSRRAARGRRRTWRRTALLAALCVVTTACGKKGPPLPPIVRVPAGAESTVARRVGDEVYVTVVTPTRNIDGSAPADVARVDVYAFTGTGPPSGAFLDVATRIATIPVAPPGQPDAAADAAQGEAVTVHERLTPAVLLPGATVPGPAEEAAALAGALRRFYVATAFSRRGVPGPTGPMADAPLRPAPAPPAEVRVAYDPAVVTVTWEASPEPVAPPLPIRYNVYRSDAASGEAPAEAAVARPPQPINPVPLETATFTEPVQLDGAERCYVVRAVQGAASGVAEGAPSPPACAVTVDVFPPGAPAGLSAVAAGGAISLIWEPNAEPDLAGYRILRGEASDATLAPLTDAPIRETRFTDRAVSPGVRYVYAVVALDDRRPVPNVSAESNRVEETAR